MIPRNLEKLVMLGTGLWRLGESAGYSTTAAGIGNASERSGTSISVRLLCVTSPCCSTVPSRLSKSPHSSSQHHSSLKMSGNQDAPPTSSELTSAQDMDRILSLLNDLRRRMGRVEGGLLKKLHLHSLHLNRVVLLSHRTQEMRR